MQQQTIHKGFLHRHQKEISLIRLRTERSTPKRKLITCETEPWMAGTDRRSGKTGMVRGTKGEKCHNQKFCQQGEKSASEMTTDTSEEDTFLLPGAGQK